jgi:uncharacterized membrane protein YvlD (DUF360 family)
MTQLKKNLSLTARLLFRYAIVWLADALSIGVTALLLPGIYFVKESEFWYLNPFIVALWLGLLNVLIRPLLIILILPINFISLGFTTLFVNSTLFYLIDRLVPSFVIESFPAALVGLLVLSAVNTVLANVIVLEEDYSLFMRAMDKLSSLSRSRAFRGGGRGLVVIQIDGLSLTTLRRAVNRGKMPFIGELLGRRGYALREWFSGLPSQTSSVQAGIFYGDKFNIPGFRWYDKKQKKLVVSSSSGDMKQIDDRLGQEEGTLLRGGTCVNTLIHGGAEKRLITLSALLDTDIRKRRGELEDFAIFSLHPYLYNRAIVLMAWDFAVDRFQRLLDIVKRKNPRVKRSMKFSLLRAVGNAFLRESTSYFIHEEIVRGTPIIYANYIGYDIIAHHAGPNSWDAVSALTGIDRQIRSIAQTIRKRAGGSYDIIVLSDHGQTKSVPFESFDGSSLSDFIEKQLRKPLLRSRGFEAEEGYFATLLREMQLAEETFGTRSIRRSRRTFERIGSRVRPEAATQEHDEGVLVCPTGNLAHIYFTEHEEKLTFERLAELHPSLLEAFGEHPGIGLALMKKSRGELILLSNHGAMHLPDGRIEGVNPLLPYGDNETIRDSLLQLGEYPDSGDVILFGAALADGAVVSFESQIGTHGGIGGEQTEAFLMHPAGTAWPRGGIKGPEDMHVFLKKALEKTEPAKAANIGTGRSAR